MNIGIAGLGMGDLARPEVYGPFVTAADEAGFATLWLPEHIVLFDAFGSQYPYARGDTRPPVGMDVANLNPYVSLSFAAGRTSRIRLGTGVTLVPEYHPLLLAKLAGCLDFLSGGRLAFGVGVGWLREEYEALGIPWERRSARTKEYVAALRELWGTRESTFKGEFVEFENVLSFPKPLAGRDFPIIYGGHSDVALRRAADYCNGIFLFNLTPDEAAERIATLHRLLEEHGRSSEGFEIIVAGLPDMTTDAIPAYRDAGAHELVIQPNHLYAAGAAVPGQAAEAVRLLADEWLSAAAALSHT